VFKGAWGRCPQQAERRGKSRQDFSLCGPSVLTPALLAAFLFVNLQLRIHRRAEHPPVHLKPGIPLMGLCHGPDGAETYAGRARPLTGEELPVLLPRLPSKLLSMVTVRTPYSRELFSRINFSPPAMRPQASTAFSSRLANTTHRARSSRVSFCAGTVSRAAKAMPSCRQRAA